MWRSGFTHDINSTSTDFSGLPAYGVLETQQGDGYLALGFSGLVAWVGEDYPFAAGSSLYLGVELLVQGGLSIGSSTNLTWFADNFVAGADSGISFEIVLAESTLLCPIYVYDGYTVASGSNFVIAAKKWWPYKTSAGDPAWEALNGTPTNQGPAA
jgi:hypothetical protein